MSFWLPDLPPLPPLDNGPALEHHGFVSEIERKRDQGRLDKAIDAWMRELDEEPGIETLGLASKCLVLLLERRSLLLGLDAQPGAETKQESQPVARILAAVPRSSPGTGTM